MTIKDIGNEIKNAEGLTTKQKISLAARVDKKLAKAAELEKKRAEESKKQAQAEKTKRQKEKRAAEAEYKIQLKAVTIEKIFYAERSHTVTHIKRLITAPNSENCWLQNYWYTAGEPLNMNEFEEAMALVASQELLNINNLGEENAIQRI